MGEGEQAGDDQRPDWLKKAAEDAKVSRSFQE